MYKNISQAINFYCSKELSDFRKSKNFLEISKLSETLEFSVESSFGKNITTKKSEYPQVIYLDISIKDNKGKTVVVDVLDNEHLGYATEIVRIDKKGRIQFLSWQKDEDFIESIMWIKRELYRRTEIK